MSISLNKLFLQTKSVAVVSLISITLILSSIVYATDDTQVQRENSSKKTSIFRDNGDMFYQFIYDHDDAFVRIADALVGGLICGPGCALLGASAAYIEERLNYYGYIDKKYLTWGIFGAAFGDKFSPGLLGKGTGAIAGFFFAGGVSEDQLGLITPAIPVLVSAVAGQSIAGPKGGLVGGALGAADNLAIYLGITDNHLLSSITVSAALLNSLNPMAAKALGEGLFLAASEGISKNGVVNTLEEFGTKEKKIEGSVDKKNQIQWQMLL
ncbi:MAG: hypothetical protein KKE11_05815 [Gammaproteobacteria bacterium]|nr:hypothetical protein [Gammaproteobacteria bacterium]